MQRRARGFTLVEVLIALAIFLVGIVWTMRMQVLGLSWTSSARAHSRAMELALELRAGLEQLPFADSRLAVTGSSGATAPTPFGSLLSDTSGATTWSDAAPIPGVTLDGALERDRANPTAPGFVRRWTVWGYSPTGGIGAGSRVIAISVIYTDRGSLQRREVLVYTHRADPTAVLTSIRTGS